MDIALLLRMILKCQLTVLILPLISSALSDGNVEETRSSDKDLMDKLDLEA